MKRKIIFAFGFLVFACAARPAFASIVISEIMYAPAEGASYEWVEIYNDGESGVDLSGWRFFHGETSGPLTLRNGASTVLPGGGYAIIAKSPSVVGDYAWLDFSGMVLSASTLSLPDSGDNTYIAIASDVNKTVSNSITYNPELGGSKESGATLSKIGAAWMGAAPTPGGANVATASSGGNEDTGESAGMESTIVSASQKTGKASTKRTYKTKVAITAPAVVHTGVGFTLRGAGTGTDGEKLFRGVYYWNFGDGSFREGKVINTDKFLHTLYYPGDYKVTLEYYPNSFADIPEASATVTVKVVAPEVVIYRTGDTKDFFVELSNNAEEDADISGWILGSAYRQFVLPRGTVIPAGQTLKISPRISLFTPADQSTLKLFTPEGDIVDTLP